MGFGSSGQRPDSGGAWSEQSRGQTTLDFAIGISIFLAVLLFIFLFLPGILSPFTESAQEETVSSNRVADQLATAKLASPSEPYVLNEYCTVEFFDVSSEPDSSVPDGCNYETGTLAEQVGIDSQRDRVNVTMRGNISASGGDNEILCWNTDEPNTGLIQESNGDCNDGGSDVLMTRGPTPTTQASITSVRVVSIDGTDATLYVEVW